MYVYDGFCSDSKCFKRHPYICHSFTQSDCRWGPNCRYLHKEKIKEIIINVEQRKKAENDIKESQANESNEDVEHCLTDKDDANSECSDDHVEESLEEILAKAEHFEDSNDDIEEVAFFAN